MLFAFSSVILVNLFLAYANLCENYKVYDLLIMIFFSALYCYAIIDLALSGNYCGILFIAVIVLYHVLKICIDNGAGIAANCIGGVLIINLITAIINFLTAPKVGLFYR